MTTRSAFVASLARRAAMVRRPLAGIVLALSIALTLVPAPAPAATLVTTGEYVADVVAGTNVARTTRGLVRLRPNACLKGFAQAQAERMARERELSHTRRLERVLSRCGMRLAGENVAYNPAGGRAVVAAWMASPGHRANILKPGYRLIGVAAVRRHGTWWAVQVFGRKA